MQFPASKSLAKNSTTFGNILFRFFCIYFVLFIIPFPISDDYGWGRAIVNQYAHIWEKITSWVGSNLLHHSFKEKEGQWGYDTLFSYVGSLAMVIVSAIICIIWTIADKRKEISRIISHWAITYLRYFLAFNMFDYGLGKVFNLQFGWARFPKLVDLVSPYGDQSPMVLLWRFMAYSNSYQVFTGAIEVLGALLMLFRRTTTLGILITIAAMSNVVMLNWSYNVDVKYYSSHLLLMGIFLLAPQVKRLADFFIFNKSTSIEILTVQVSTRLKLMFKIFQVILLLAIAWEIYIFFDARFVKKYAHESDPPLYGIYKTESFILNRDTLPPLMTDSTRWKQMIVDRRETDIYFMNEKINYGHATVDTIRKQLIITSGNDSLDKYVLSYRMLQKDQIIFEGTHKNDSLHIRMKKVDINDFRLVRMKPTWLTDE